MSYHTQFIEAFERTKLLGLNPPTISETIEPSYFKTKNEMNAHFFKIQKAKFKKFLWLIEKAAERPYASNYGLPSTVNRSCGWTGYLTIGTVDFSGASPRDIHFDEEFILNTLQNKQDEDFVLQPAHNENMIRFLPPHFQVWVTLPSMEIVDQSILPFLWKSGFLAEKPKNFLVAQYPEEIENLKYTPILLGGDFLKKTNLVMSS